MRTRFRWEDVPEPVQEVLASVELTPTLLDWRPLPSDERAAHLQSFLEADRERSFDLQAAPLTRVSLIRYDERDFDVVWTWHHLIADGREHLAGFQEPTALSV